MHVPAGKLKNNIKVQGNGCKQSIMLAMLKWRWRKKTQWHWQVLFWSVREVMSAKWDVSIIIIVSKRVGFKLMCNNLVKGLTERSFPSNFSRTSEDHLKYVW